MTANRPAVVVRGLVHGYLEPTGPRRVLDGIDLDVAPGEVVAISGRSGSGKSTLLTILAGLERPAAGTVEIAGIDPSATPPPWGAVALLPQALGLLEELTIAENVSLPLRLGGAPATERAEDMLARLRIEHLADRLPSEVSLGEQQRTALARAAVAAPDVLLADEPLSHQNDAFAEVMVDLLADLAAGGTACVLASHDPLVNRAAQRVLALRDGSLVPASS